MATVAFESAQQITTPQPRPHLYQLLLSRAERFPDSVALGSQHGLAWRTLTSRQLLATVERLAGDLARAGVGEGDRVVLWVPNTLMAPVYFFALWRLGAIVVPFDRDMNPAAGARILEMVQPRMLIGGYGEAPGWAADASLTEWWEPQNLSAHGATAAPAPWTTPKEDLAAIYYTSGTTGNPKGCMISHTNLCSQVEVLRANIPIDDTSRLASILPLSHLFELTCGLLFPLSVGAAVHYIPSRRAPDILRVIAEQHVTNMVAVPELLTSMAQGIEVQLKARLPGAALGAMLHLADHLGTKARRALFLPVHRKLGGHLRLIAAGGAPLPIGVQRLWERLGIRIVLGYGSSECSPIVTCGSPDGATPFGSVGKPISGVQVRLRPDGELEVKGPNVMRGYFKDPERTAEVLRDGWYATGDIGSLDKDGNVTITGRVRDLLVLPSGMKVWPADVEDVLKADAAVRDAAVVPVSGERGITLHAYLIPASPKGSTEEAVRVATRCNRALAVHQRVATASWWPDEDFPRTSTLKIRRHLLPQPAITEQMRQRASTAALVGDAVGQALIAVTHSKAIRPDQTLVELGVDSFGLVELALSIEQKTGVAIDENRLAVSMTVDQLRSQVADLKGSGGEQEPPFSMPAWLYTLGRMLRGLSFPVDFLYRWAALDTIVMGKENLSHLSSRVIFAGTHHSYPDLPLLRFALAQTPARGLRGRLAVATAAENFAASGPLGKYAMVAFGLFPLARTGDREASLRELLKVARAGNVVVIFPQGRHARPQEEIEADPIADFKPGFAYLAEALAADVVPFGLAGTEVMVPPYLEEFRGRVIAGVPLAVRRTALAIAFGPAMRQTPGEDLHSFTDRVQKACFELSRVAERARETS